MKIGAQTAIPPLNLDRVDPQLVSAAKGMEANFMRQMMKTMRETVDESEDERHNQGIQIFRGMLDDHYAEQAANQNGLGIAEMIIRYLTQQESVPLAVEKTPVPVASESLKKGPEVALEGK